MAGDWTRVDTTYLDAGFFDDVRELLDNDPSYWVVTEAYRTMDRSNLLFVNYRLNKGPRAAPGGISPHNYGMAIDIALDGDPIRKGVQAVWDVAKTPWIRLTNSIWKHPRLRSGKWYSDWPHIERLRWKDYVAWRQNYEDNIHYLVKKHPELQKHLPKVA